MRTSEEIAADLSQPLDRKNVSTRSQSGRNLSYIEAHHAIREANRIFGFDNWHRQTRDVSLVQSEQKDGQRGPLWYVGYVAKCEIRADIDGSMVIREGTGFGQGQDADLGKAHESAIKEAESDAMKRALMTFGDPFGLALYDKTQGHVENVPQAPKTRAPRSEGYTAVDQETGEIKDKAAPTNWTPPVLMKQIRDNNLTVYDLSPVLGEKTDTQNFAPLVDRWMAAAPDRDTAQLVELAVKAKLPEPSPADLSPRADTRQAAMV